MSIVLRNIPSKNEFGSWRDYMDYINELINSGKIQIPPNYKIITDNEMGNQNKDIIVYDKDNNTLVSYTNNNSYYFYKGLPIIMIRDDSIPNKIVADDFFTGNKIECAICLNDFTQDEIKNRINDISVLPCEHAFHTNCIKHAVGRKCPMCRAVYNKYLKYKNKYLQLKKYKMPNV